MITDGTSAIEVDSGVNVIIYITGNVNLNGDGLVNDSQVASHVLINGIEPAANPDGTLPSRSITISTDQDFEGVIYAPNHGRGPQHGRRCRGWWSRVAARSVRAARRTG